MRELKFRAYCNIGDENKMLYFTEGKYDNGLWFEHTSNHIDEYLSPLMQFTGLKDQGGKGQDIYEGDCFQTDKKWFVEWQEDLCRFVLTTGNGYDSKNCVDLTCDEVYYLKIAGNKYENKD
ncbi:YopX protein [compost metagenome]